MKNLQFPAVIVGIILTVMATGFFSSHSFANSGAEEKKVNINTASAAELETLPRIGPKIAQRIIDFRKENGKFQRIEELMKVKGIGEKLFLGLKDRLTVGSEAKKK